MITYKQGDIILIEFLFSDGSGSKKRPAMILSNEKYHKKRKEVIILAVTSNIRRILPGDTKLENWHDANLLKPSVATGIMQTIQKQNIYKKIGSLLKTDKEKVMKNIENILSLE